MVNGTSLNGHSDNLAGFFIGLFFGYRFRGFYLF
jgi:hypothetical protein